MKINVDILIKIRDMQTLTRISPIYWRNSYKSPQQYVEMSLGQLNPLMLHSLWSMTWQLELIPLLKEISYQWPSPRAKLESHSEISCLCHSDWNIPRTPDICFRLKIKTTQNKLTQHKISCYSLLYPCTHVIISLLTRRLTSNIRGYFFLQWIT